MVKLASRSWFERGRHDAVEVEGLVVTFVLLGLMEGPVLIKVVAGAQGAQLQDGLVASQVSAGPGHFHTVFDQRAAGTFNDSRGDGQSLGKVTIVLEVGHIGAQVVRTVIHWFTNRGDKTSPCGAAAHAPAT